MPDFGAVEPFIQQHSGQGKGVDPSRTHNTAADNPLFVQDGISEDLSSFIPSLQDKIVTLLTSSVDSGALTTAQMKDAFKLVLTAIRQTKKYFKDSTEAGSLWKSDAWDGLLDQLTSSEKYGRATGLHAMCKQVRDATRLSEPREAKKMKKSEGVTASGEKSSKSKAKRKAEEVEAPSEKPQKPKKKRARVVAETI